MRKTLIASAMAMALVSGPVLATNTSASDSSSAGASITSGAVASSSGNGGAYTATGGYQRARATSDSEVGTLNLGSLLGRTGGSGVSGTAKVDGAAWSKTFTYGSGVAGSGTGGRSVAVSDGRTSYDMHGSKPEGYAAGGAEVGTVNVAKTFSFGLGGAVKGNKSGTSAEYEATSLAHKGWLFGSSAKTSAMASSVSYDLGGGFSYGFGDGQFGFGSGFQFSDTSGSATAEAGAKAGAKAGNSQSNN